MSHVIILRRISTVLLLLSAAFPQRTSAQPDEPIRFTSAQWTMDEGLPQSSVNDIIQTSDGYLWLATFGGLVRFDGTDFDVYDRSNSPGMRSDRVLNLLETADGSVWGSTEDGVVRKQGDKITTYFITEGSSKYSPSMMASDARGTMWVTSDAVVYHFENDAFTRVPVRRDPVNARKAVNDANGVWLVHRREVVRTLGDSAYQILDLRHRLRTNIIDIAEHPVGSGVYWIATMGEGILRVAPGDTTLYSVERGLPSVYMRNLYVDRKGDLWVTAYNGTSRWQDGRFIPIRTAEGKPDRDFSSFIQDREGNFWLGTPSNGLFRLRPAVITMIDQRSGLQELKMLSIERRRDGTILFGTNCGGVYEWKDGTARYSAINRWLINLCIWSVLEDSRGRVWTGSRQLTRFDRMDRPGKVFDSTNGFFGLDIFALHEDRNGILWIGCLNGLFRFDGTAFTRFSRKDGLPNDDVRTIVESPDGRLWIGTTDGVGVMENGRITEFPIMPESGPDGRLRSRYVRAIHHDADGTIWFGTYGGGIVRWKQGRWSVITTAEGLYDNIVSHLVDDGNGTFWMGSNRGIFAVSRDELRMVADSSLRTLKCQVFTARDGMASAETNGGFQPSVAVDEEGRLYFPTVSGVAVVNTRSARINTIVPPVVVENIVANTRHLPAGLPVILPPDSTNLTLHYAALSFSDPAKVRYRFKLEGLDHDWTDAGTRRTAYYPNLPPGEWTFRVIASNNDGVWNTIGASIPVTVLPPFWMTWWFRTLIVLFFLVAGPSAYYLRVSQLEKEKRNQLRFAEQLIESQERERRRIAADLHDGIGQQILIIKNRAELAMAYVSDPSRMKDQLKEIAGSALSSINDLRGISHDLRPVHLEDFGLTETIRTLAEHLQAGSSIQWIVNVEEIDGILPKEKEINFYRILQEASKNILQHSGAMNASLIVRRTDNAAVATLWDDGRGFDAEGPQERPGMGLRGMVERARTFGGSVEVRSQPGNGTSITVTAPAEKERTT
ncbi:MAG: hypothetical protein HUU02_06515 [Bacteroidetes bacterium]|nr:hypothetical protein [Bacteroidota bacterium]